MIRHDAKGRITHKDADIWDLLKNNLDSTDILKILSDNFISESLKNGADFEITESVAQFGEDNSDNALYENDGDFESWGEFLLSVPGNWQNIKLPSGKVFSIIE